MGDRLQRLSFQTNRFFGTSSRAELFVPCGREGRKAAVAAWRSVGRSFDEIQRAASTTVPESDVARYNAAPPGERVPVCRHTANLVCASRIVAEATGGAFDPTVAPLVDLWGFSAGERNAGRPRRSDGFPAPSAEEVRAALPLVGMDGVGMEEDGEGRACLVKEPVAAPPAATPPGRPRLTRGLDFGGIAKGYAADAACGALRAAGMAWGYLNCGGSEIALLANPGCDDGAWRVPVLDPRDASLGACFEVAARDTVVTTSAEYQHVRRIEGREASHIIDPRTGYPFSFERDPDAPRVVCAVLEGVPASAADGLATALCAMPPREAFELASSERFRSRYRALLFVVGGSRAGGDPMAREKPRACSYFSTFDERSLREVALSGPGGWARVG